MRTALSPIKEQRGQLKQALSRGTEAQAGINLDTKPKELSTSVSRGSVCPPDVSRPRVQFLILHKPGVVENHL